MRPVREYALLPFRYLMMLGLLCWVCLDFVPKRKAKKAGPVRLSASVSTNRDSRLASLLVTRGSDESADIIEVPLTGRAIDRLIMELSVQKCRINSEWPRG